jgi:release factor glutamine methyltransferase
VGADISAEALAVAERNAARLLSPGAEGADDMQEMAPVREPAVRWLRSDLFENVEGRFDMIVSNPPYIPSGVIETLMPEVRDHEPRQALDGMEDGLHFYRRIIADSVRFLKGGGKLLFEIGFDQGDAVKSLMEQAGYLEVRVIKDYAGLDRVVEGTLSFAAANAL